MISFLKERVTGFTQSALRCAYCHDDLPRKCWTCPRCSSKIHSQCASELTECPTLGCRESVESFVSDGARIIIRKSRQEEAIEDCRVLRSECEKLKSGVSANELNSSLGFILSLLPMFLAMKVVLLTNIKFVCWLWCFGELNSRFFKWFVENRMDHSVLTYAFSILLLIALFIGRHCLLEANRRKREELASLEAELKEARRRLGLI